MSKHTPERRTYSHRVHDVIIKSPAVPRGHLVTIWGPHAAVERIVACDNALEGINPESVPMLVKACKQARKATNHLELTAGLTAIGIALDKAEKSQGQAGQ